MKNFFRFIFVTETPFGLIFRIPGIIFACLIMPFGIGLLESMAKSGAMAVAKRNRKTVIKQYGLEDAKGEHFEQSGFFLDTKTQRLITYSSYSDGIAVEMPFSKIQTWTLHWLERQNGSEFNFTIKFRTSDDTTPVFSIGPFASRQSFDSWDQRFSNLIPKT